MVDAIFSDRQRVALLWLTTALGGLIYAEIVSVSYLNAYVRGKGAMEAETFDGPALWALSIAYAIWIVPALLAVIGRGAIANWTILVVGGFLVLTNTLDSIGDGIRDGGHITATGLIAITLPGLFALLASWRLLRNSGA